MAKVNSHSQYCAAINCSNSRAKNPGLSFFFFPKPGKTGDKEKILERCKQWWINTRRDDLNFKKDHSKIIQLALCEEHFLADQFMNPAEKGCFKPRKNLRKDAIPTLFNIPNPPKPVAQRRVLQKRPIDCPTTQEVPSKKSRDDEYSGSSGTASDLPSCSSQQNPASVCTPTKARLKKKVAMYRKRNARITDKLQKANAAIKRLSQKKSDLETAKTVIAEHLSGNAYNLVMAQLTMSVKRNRKKWNRNMKLYCLSLFHKSPSAYRFLRKTFAVPSVSTLQRIFRNVSIDCGFSSGFFSVLKTKAANMTGLDKYCSVCVDEMSIKAALSYQVSSDKIVGFENLGSVGTGQGVGRQALVFMATGLFSRWKQPLGYFISKSTTKADILKLLLTECLTSLSDTGLIVKSIVCDQGSSNQKLVKMLNVSLEKPYFVHDHNQICVFFDPPHLLKSMRNNLKSHDIMVEGQKVSWRYIERMYEIDSARPFELRLASKLTKKHITLPAFSKMKVKRAAQIFSQSVHSALTTYICSSEIPYDALHTAVFVKNMDSLFDIFNSSSLIDRKPFRCALKESSPSLDFLCRMKAMMENITVLGLKVQPPCIYGWKLSISALRYLWDDVKVLPNVKYLCTRKINQDPLENMFSVIRSRGGFCDNPNAKQFSEAYKRVCIKSFMSQSELANCEADVNDVLLDAFNTNVFLPSNPIAETSDASTDTECTIDLDINNQTIPKQNALTYVAGYTAMKYLRQHSNCSKCSALLKKYVPFENQSNLIFMYNKAYSHEKDDYGGLCMPTAEFVSFITHCEGTFKTRFLGIMHSSKICLKLVNAIMDSANLSWFTATDCAANIRGIVRAYVKMRIHYAVKFFNETLQSEPRNKQNRKTLKLQNL